jgi:hypothetical protein
MIEGQDFISNGTIKNESLPMFVAIVGIDESGVRNGGRLASKTSNELQVTKIRLTRFYKLKYRQYNNGNSSNCSKTKRNYSCVIYNKLLLQQ